ncbi:MAG TPA: GNAT family N-acetyltransferase [Acidimicrobiales bacterium]|nr:GNAT family N-acetyltransferase [Acidimicrobiales bacterium]
MDRWFAEHAWVAQRQDSARTFVLIDDADRVVGFYSLAMGSVEKGVAPSRLVRGLPRHPVPMVLLARLAIDESAQGAGLGKSLLFEALHRAALAAEHAAARLIAVDPVDEDARRFYLRWGFAPVEGDVGGRLFVRTRDALASFPADYGTE